MLYNFKSKETCGVLKTWKRYGREYILRISWQNIHVNFLIKNREIFCTEKILESGHLTTFQTFEEWGRQF